MILRAATSHDVDALIEVQREGAIRGLSHIFPQDKHPFPETTIATRWRREIAGPDFNVFLYVSEGGRIEGFAAIHEDELLHFGTAVSTWGSGLASRFHNALLAWVTAELGAPATLRLRVFERNGRARRFYEKHGWQLTAVSTRTTFPPHPLLLEYERELPGGGLEPPALES